MSLKFKSNCFFILLYVLLLCFVDKVFSHPHVFLDNKVKFKFNNEGLKNIFITWQFDEMSSSGMIMDYDENKDGNFSSKEANTLQGDFLKNLKKLNYFTYLSINNKNIKSIKLKNVKTYVTGHKIHFTFSLDTPLKAINKIQEVKLSVYDQTYYSDIKTKINDIKIINPGSLNISHKIQKNKSKTYYFKSLHPIEIVVTFKKK
jgi:ABC-type uncharacterized transport system substrate-binding protein